MSDKKREIRLRYLVEDFESDPDFVSLLNIVDMDEPLPFKLPPELYWPKGEKAKSIRASILMRCGLKYLTEKYIPKPIEPVAVEKESARPMRKGAAADDPFAAI